MAARIIKELYGFSGNQILLMEKHNRLFVRKLGDVMRNVERMYALKDKYPLPEIYNYSKNKLDIEYIHSLDIKTYLKSNHHESLLQFIINILDRFKETSAIKDYSDVYETKLNQINFNDFQFTKKQLIDNLPAYLPQSEYHGDFTLENILHNESKGFLLIDCVTSEYDSYIFDIAKMRQDLECGWFTRHDNQGLTVKTKLIQSKLFELYPESNNNYLLILMLLRVYRYSKSNTFERNFLVKGINNLWK